MTRTDSLNTSAAKRSARLREESKRVVEIKAQLEQLDIETKLQILGDKDFYRYSGYDALRTLRNFGNTVISTEMIGEEGIESAEKAFEKILGVPVTITFLPSTGAGDLEAYKVEVESRQRLNDLPDPLYIKTRLGVDGKYTYSLSKEKVRRARNDGEYGSPAFTDDLE